VEEYALPREYRMTGGRRAAYVAAVTVGTVSVLASVLGPGLPAGVTLPFVVVWLASMGWLMYAALHASTAADIKAIHVRGLVRRRRLAWPDIQDIRAEVNPSAAMQGNAPKVLVHAYGRDGSKVLLLFVDDRHVPHLRYEVEMLQALWRQLRGADWAPDPAAAVLIERHVARHAAMTTGCAATAMGAIPLLALALLPLFVDVPGWSKTVLNPLVVLGAGMPLIFALTAVASYRRWVRGR